MSRDGSDVLQSAIYAALTAEFSEPSIGVFDHIPQSTDYPYVAIGDGSVSDWGSKDNVGTEQDIQIEIWSRYRGRKQAHLMAGRVYDVLHEQDLTVSGQQCVLIRFESQERTRDGDGDTYRIALRYRALLADTA